MSSKNFSSSNQIVAAKSASHITSTDEQALNLVDGGSHKSSDVVGFMDMIHGLCVMGWALDKNNVSDKLSLEILNDGNVIALTEADKLRDDVKASGIGDGYCGFSVMMPDLFFDGEPHQIQVRVRSTGTVLKGGRTLQRPKHTLIGHLDGLHGSTLSGWVKRTDDSGVPVTIRAWIDGVPFGEFVADIPFEGGGKARFMAPVPPLYLDGMVHHFKIEAPEYAFEVGSTAAITPTVLTSFDLLQKVGSSYLLGYLAPTGPLRYETLRTSLHAIMDRHAAEQPSALLKELSQLYNSHEQIMRGIHAKPSDFTAMEFPQVEQPLVTIVIPVHNKFAMTYNCLASLLMCSNKASFEVVVIDDGSDDETLAITELVSGIKLVRHDVAEGFIRSCNRAAREARGEYIVLLNNDTEVTGQWLDELIDPFHRFADVGLTGAKLLYPDGRLQEAGGLVWSDGNPWNVGRNGNAHAPQYNYTRQVDFLSGACVMIPTALWRSLNGLDEHFVPAYFEDTDLAYRVREKGLKTVYTPFSQVMHFEGQSNGTSTLSGIKKFQVINEPKFKSRWIRQYRNNGVDGKDSPLLEQDRNINMRVLVLDAQTPTPDRDAGSYAAVQEIRILQSLGFKVTFVPSNLAYLGEYTEQLQRMGVEVVYAPFASSMNEVIEKRAGEFDLFYIFRYGVAAQVIDSIRAKRRNAKIILNSIDLHFLREIRDALQKDSAEAIQSALKTREIELAVMRKVDLVISYSSIENAVIQSHNLGSTKLAICPWVAATSQNVPTYSQRQDIAFLGGFSHAPNEQAVVWFVTKVMPLIRTGLPGVRFLIYGSNAPESLKKLVADDVILKGYVKTTEEVYDSARLFVAPLLTGAGIKGKVIGALANGLPTLLTPIAAEGTGVRSGREALIMSTPQEWADGIIKLYRNEKAWNAMSKESLEFAKEAYSFEHGQKLIMDALHLIGLFADTNNNTLYPKK